MMTAQPDPVQRSANVERGEIAITLDGAPFVMRPTFEAMSLIERGTGKSLITLAREADGRLLSLQEMGVIAAECIRAWGREHKDRSAAGVNAPRVAELIYEAGLVTVVPMIAVLLVNAVTGGNTKPAESGGDDNDGEEPGEQPAAA